MATLSTTRNYDDGQVLVRADLDIFLDDIETFINVTKISDDNIQNSGITASSKLLNASITSNKMAANSIVTAAITDGNVTTAKIADANVTNAKMAAASVDTAQLVDLAVATAKINDGAVTNAKLANDSVATVNIIDSNVTTAKINDSAVTTAKINNGAVTPGKHSTNYSNDSLTQTQSGTGTAYAQQATQLVTSGRPVMIVLYSGSASATTTGIGSGSFSTATVSLSRYDVNATSHTTIQQLVTRSDTSSGTTPLTLTFASHYFFIDTPSAGTYQYEIKLAATNGSLSTAAAACSSLKIITYEL